MTRATSLASTHPTAALLPSLAYIQSHLDAELSLAQLAERATLSPYYFHRLFHAVVGETPKQYTQRLRLERAAFDLKIRDATILEIALNWGFQAPETFTRAFKRWFGVTPDPRRLAAYLLRTDTSWTAERIEAAMDRKTELGVPVRPRLPVVIGYFTAWVDEDGRLNFRDDIYGHNARLARELFNEPTPADEHAVSATAVEAGP